MEINEAGQLLLPLVGINRKKLNSIIEDIEAIGLVDNRLAIRASSELDIDFEVAKGTKYVYLIQPLSKYNKDFNRILMGDFYNVKTSTKALILNNLSANKSKWRGIFNNSKEAIETKLISILGKSRYNLDDVVADLYRNINKNKKTLSKFSAYTALNKLNLTIDDNKNQLSIAF